MKVNHCKQKGQTPVPFPEWCGNNVSLHWDCPAHQEHIQTWVISTCIFRSQGKVTYMDSRWLEVFYHLLFMLIFFPLKTTWRNWVINFILIGRVFSGKCPIYREKIDFLGWFFFNSEWTESIWLDVATGFYITQIKMYTPAEKLSLIKQ